MGAIGTAARAGRSAMLCLAAGGAILSAPAAHAGPAKPCLEILAPAPGAAVLPGRVLVIGTAKGEKVGQVRIEVDGKEAGSAPVNGGGFAVAIRVPRGRCVVGVAAGTSSVSIPLTGDAKGSWRYHADIEKCEGCHEGADKGYAVPGRKDALCYRCHDRQDGGRLVHGPLGGGDCTACHAPHGSANPRHTVARAETLCVTCHDQQSTAEHLKRARGKACTECHTPHSSDKAYLGR